MLNYKEQGKTLAQSNYREVIKTGATCPFCGQTVGVGDEICLHCGHKLVLYCTFCGAPMSPDDKECSQCGTSADGIICPKCGSLSFRAFCPVCNNALTRAAQKAVEKAQSDPKFQQVQELVAQIGEMREQLFSIESIEDEEDSDDAEVSVQEDDSRAFSVEQGSIPEKVEITKEKTFPCPTVSQEKTVLKKQIETLEKDINQLLSEMLPPVGATPQQQRNFYCARKVEIVKKKEVTRSVKDPVGWVCNLCGCLHRQPSECAKPELGGRWIYGKTHYYTETITTKINTEIQD